MEVSADGISHSNSVLWNPSLTFSSIVVHLLLPCVRVWTSQGELGRERKGQAPAWPPYCTWVQEALCTGFRPVMMTVSEDLSPESPPERNICQNPLGCLEQKRAWEMDIDKEWRMIKSIRYENQGAVLPQLFQCCSLIKVHEQQMSTS